MRNIFYDAPCIFHHYLECSIPEEQWKRMTFEETLIIPKMLPLYWMSYYLLRNSEGYTGCHGAIGY